ncbi:MAG: hypothetical protein PHD37_05075 [Gallionellaceae bacterium]|nr:hypothetical protein [Gallionellaceae bacterium]
MFEGIKSFIRETRIKFDYPRFESEQTMAHRAEAERRFDISQLQREVAQIKAQAGLAGDQRFGDEISPLRKKLAVLERDFQKHLEQLEIFERNYKSELDDLYAQKELLFQAKEDLLAESKRLRDERSLAHQELDEAYEDLEEAKNDVDRWYAKSERTPWLFGNSGKKLPKHSMFGQSFGDLEAAKSRRGDAVDEIGDCKRRITSIKGSQSANRVELDRNRNEIGKVLENIAEVKAARQRMFDLKKEGVQPEVLRRIIRQLQSSRTGLEEEILTLKKRRSVLVEETEIRMGVREREAAIADLLARKRQFLDLFHSEQSKAARQELHRRQWIERHG